MASPDAVAVSPTLEAEWERLSRYIALSEGFWLGFAFTASASDARALRERVEGALEGQGRSLFVLTPASPPELRDVLAEVFEPAALRAGCIWIEANLEEPLGAAEGPWSDAWGWVVLRMNERRERMRRTIRGGLVLVMPPSLKTMVREAASDLWDVRSIVVELEPGGPIKPPMPGSFPLPAESHFPNDLTGAEYKMLTEALASAFPSRSKLAMMLLFRLHKDLDKIIDRSASLEESAFEVIGAARSQGWLLDLVSAARASNPGDPDLVAFCQHVGVLPDLPEEHAKEPALKG